MTIRSSADKKDPDEKSKRLEPIMLLGFKHYTEYFTFNKRTDSFLSKELKNYLNVGFAI